MHGWDKEYEIFTKEYQELFDKSMRKNQESNIEFLEDNLSNMFGRNVVVCNSGTDALLLGLISLGLKPNEGVIVPSFTFASTAEAVCMLGGVPFFSDVNIDTFNICEKSLLRCVAEAKKQGIKLKGIISVGLFGQPCDIDSIIEIANAHKLWVLDDAAQ